MIKVLFVCLGNICRSPMAEAVFREKVAKANLSDKIHVDSAGTADWHTGKPPHEGTRGILDERNISYENMTARQIKQADFGEYNYIVAMDDSNMENIFKDYQMHENTVLKKLMDYVDNPKETNVPDPYYTGDFNYTYELVEEASERLLDHILKNAN